MKLVDEIGKLIGTNAPPAIALALAARASLRVLPRVWAHEEKVLVGERGQNFALFIVHASVRPWHFCHKLPFTRLGADDLPEKALWIRLCLQRSSVISSLSDTRSDVSFQPSTIKVLQSIFHLNRVVDISLDSSGGRRILSAAEQSIIFSVLGSEIDDDLFLNFIEEDRKTIYANRRIEYEPLWQNQQIPVILRNDLQKFKEILLSEGDSWGVWLQWYSHRLRGGPTDLEVERIYASMEPSWLEQGAAAYNAELKRRLDALAERRALETPDETVPEITTEALPEQVPQGARFDAPPAGPIRLADFAPPVDGLVDTPEQQEDWEDIRAKARAVGALGPNRVPDGLAEKLDRVLALDARLGDVRAQRLWSCFGSLRIARAAHEAGAAAELRTGEPDPRTLNAETADALTDLVETYNAFTLAQPKLLERDAARPGPQEAEELQQAAAPILPVLAAAAADREITTAEASDALETAREGLETPPESLPERQAAQTSAATARNFVAALLGRAWRGLCAEGGVAWKGAREGFYRAIGTTAYAAVPAAPFIAAHRDQLIAYVTTNFPGNTMLVKIIETIALPFGG